MDPANIVVAVFIFSTFFAAANYSSWGDIEGVTVAVILSSVIAFAGGCQISRRVTFGHNSKAIAICDLPELVINRLHTVLVVSFMIVITILDFYELRSILTENVSGLLSIVAGARHSVYAGTSISHSPIVQQGIYACRALAYVYIFIVSYRRIVNKEWRILEYVPIALYFIQALLSTGRTEFIYIIYGWLVISYIISLRNNRWESKLDFRFSKKIIIAISIFILLFLFLSNIRSSNGSIDVFTSLSNYIGSPIIALNNYIVKNGLSSNARYFGEETMSLYYSVTNAFGFSDMASVSTLSPINIGGKSTLTNIYTALRRYLFDYGIWWTLCIVFVEGAFYGKLFDKLKKIVFPFLRVIIYAFITYPLVEMAIEERFFSNLVTARTVYCIIYICVFYRILVKYYYTEDMIGKFE